MEPDNNTQLEENKPRPNTADLYPAPTHGNYSPVTGSQIAADEAAAAHKKNKRS